MHQIIAMGSAKDLKKWEAGFRTHHELFKKQSVISPIRFSTSEENNEIAILFEVRDLDTCLEVMNSPETDEAREHDGILAQTIKIFVLDKEFAFE